MGKVRGKKMLEFSRLYSIFWFKKNPGVRSQKRDQLTHWRGYSVPLTIEGKGGSRLPRNFGLRLRKKKKKKV